MSTTTSAEDPLGIGESVTPPKALSIYPIEQPPPQDGGIPVGAAVRSVFEQVLAHQEAKGLAKYNTVLQTHNGRDPLIDALGEIVDALQYLVQAIMEHN